MADKQIDTNAVLALLVEKLSQMGSGGISAEQLDAILKKNSEGTADAFGRIMIPENKIHPGVSVFSHPEGDVARPKAKLAREYYFCGVLQKEDTLTPTEIDALNSITCDCEARGGQWWAKVKKDGSKEKVWIFAPCADLDDRMALPSMLAITKELAEGPTAVDLETLSTRMKDLETQLAAARAKQ